jgi:hypothetical protein
MEAICSYETSADFGRNTRRYIPEDNTLHNYTRIREVLGSNLGQAILRFFPSS